MYLHRVFSDISVKVENTIPMILFSLNLCVLSSQLDAIHYVTRSICSSHFQLIFVEGKKFLLGFAFALIQNKRIIDHTLFILSFNYVDNFK